MRVTVCNTQTNYDNSNNKESGSNNKESGIDKMPSNTSRTLSLSVRMVMSFCTKVVCVKLSRNLT